MKITELQDITVYRVQDAQHCEEMLIIQEDIDVRFYVEIDLKYSNFEKAKEKLE